MRSRYPNPTTQVQRRSSLARAVAADEMLADSKPQPITCAAASYSAARSDSWPPPRPETSHFAVRLRFGRRKASTFSCSNQSLFGHSIPAARPRPPRHLWPLPIPVVTDQRLPPGHLVPNPIPRLWDKAESSSPCERISRSPPSGPASAAVPTLVIWPSRFVRLMATL